MKASEAPSGQLPLLDKTVSAAPSQEPRPPRDCVKCGGLIVPRRIMSDTEYHCLQCGCQWRPPATPAKPESNPLARESRSLRAKRLSKAQRRLLETPPSRPRRRPRQRQRKAA